MNKKLLIIAVILILFLAIESIQITGLFAEETKKEGPFIVSEVIDGDTVRLNTEEKVRLSGINTAERGECYYEEAKSRLKELVLNKPVYLETDVTDRDKYDRLLRYIYINSTMINALLVEEGFAKVYDKYKEDTKYYEKLKEIEKNATEKGIWLCSDIRENCTYVASKNSDIYHQANSSIAKRILPENILCFISEKEAEDAGFRKP